MMAKLLGHSTAEGRTEDVLIKENATFESLLLGDKVLKGLKKNGYEKPSPIQLKAVPVGRCGFDLMVKSKSGTGKTLIFTIIALENVDVTNKAVQVLIIAPAREIAVQIADVISQIGCFIEGLKVQSFIGGTPLAGDKEKCNNCHIAIGTPGRLKHLIDEKTLVINAVRIFVLDEVDKLTDKTFLNDINEIYNCLPGKKQIITASATYPEELENFLSQYMLSPTFINTELNSPLLLGLKQFVKIIESHSNVIQQMQVKNEALLHVLSTISFTQCLVFSNYQSRAESISNFLNQKGWHSTFISGAQTQIERLCALNSLKDFKCRIMLSTDLIARGIDAANVDLVINYDIPADAMTYLHRMGRAGRFGSSGICINFAFAGKELTHLQHILGCIGGSELSIPILPDYNGSLSGLLALDISQDQYVKSVVNDEITDIVRGKILELKANKCTNLKHKTEKNKKNKTHSDKQQTEAKVSDDMNVLNDQSELEKVKGQLTDVETTEILESLASGKFDFKADHTTASIRSLLSSTAEEETTLQKSVGKSESSTQITLNKEQELLCKNKALLSVAKILEIGSGKAEETSINEYLDVLKNQENIMLSNVSKMLDSAGNESEISSILENSEHVSKTDTSAESSENTDKSYTLENIYALGYDSIVKSDGKAWSDWKACREAEAIAEESFIEEEQNYYENDDSGEVNNETVEIMKWVPVTKPTNQTRSSPKDTSQTSDGSSTVWMPVPKTEEMPVKPTCVDDYDQFLKCFEHCSDNLWYNGLSFENVENFDNWFTYEWETQMYSVRHYVQQKIYIHEMSKLPYNAESEKQDFS